MSCTKQSIVIAALCMMDLASTIWLLTHHGAAEANPLMSFFLAQGVAAFIVAKLAFTVIPLWMLEWARMHRPTLAHRALSGVIVAYIGLYVLGVAKINGGPGLPEVINSMPEDPARAVLWAEIEAATREEREAWRRLPTEIALRGVEAAAPARVAAPALGAVID